jgi:hypothetical protein
MVFFLQAAQKCPFASLCLSLVFAAYKKYASFLVIAHALQLNIFEQPVKMLMPVRWCR